MHRYFESHRATLDSALRAAAQRTYWSAAPEAPSGKIYGETAKAKAYEIAGSPGARTATPAIFVVDAADATLYGEEQFGPISFVIATADTRESIDTAVQLARSKGAITGSVYSTNEAVLSEAADKFAAAGVNLSCNLTGGVFVNQSAAFSDFHVSGGNPAGNACLTDAAFVANRFRAIGIRRPAAA